MRHKAFFNFSNMALPNHNPDGENLSVYDMVLNRLWILADTERNKSIIGTFTLELMNELETCFKVSHVLNVTTGEVTIDLTRIGDENFYTVLQRSIVADLVCTYILMIAAYGGDFTTGSGTVPNEALKTFLKKAKADVTEVEYDQFDLRKDTASKFIGGADMISLYSKSAIRKARTLGCLIDICNDCSLAIEIMLKEPAIVPFIYMGGCCGCGC